jgi:competence protein ComEA
MRSIGRVLAVGLLCGLTFMPIGGIGQAAAGAVDLNTASVEQLTELPGIGPAKAKAIVAYREQAPFAKPEDLRNVKGIGDALYEKVKDHVTVSAPKAPSGRDG